MRTNIKLLLLGLVGLYVLCLLSFFHNWQNIKEQRVQIHENYQTYARSLSNSISAQFFERYGDARAFAASVKTYLRDPVQTQSLLNHYVDLYKVYDLILIVDARGKYLASSSVSAAGKSLDISRLGNQSYSSEIWFQNALGQKFTKDEERGISGVFVGDVSRDRLTTSVYGEDRYGNTFSAPIYNERNEVIAVLCNRANFRWVEDEFVEMYKNWRKAGVASMELTLINKSGELIVDFDPSSNKGDLTPKRNYEILNKFNLVNSGLSAAREVSLGFSGSLVSKHLRKGIEQITGYSPVDSSKFVRSIGWGVLVRTEENEVFSSLNSAITQLLTSIVCFCLATIGITLFFVKYIRELNRQERFAAESSKLIALGEMAGGVAHEINNPLAVIKTRISQLRRLITSDAFTKPTGEKFALEIEETVNRVTKIVAGLKSFSRSDADDEKTLVDLDKIITDVSGLCSERMRSHGVNFTASGIKDFTLSCRPVQIEQVLVNLVNNSFDAIEALPERWIRVECIEHPLNVEIVVTDCGGGIPTEVAEKLMQPFFTTKPVGKGTGLGLSISFGIVKAHGGELVLNRNSSNTQFIVRLPRAVTSESGAA